MDKKSPFGLKPGQLSRLLAIGKEEDAVEPQKADAPGSTAGGNKAPEQLPAWIGRYKVLEVLGEGGMGIVYLAQQEHPIQRTVALKLIKPGMDSRQVIARFEAERQTLALLDHPHIAHILDAGTTDAGRPYFVMEYVQGLPLTEYCDQEKLTIEERLSLFLQVCEAIQHAHGKRIVHRDIKPSNILVSAKDGKAVPKVIDFGVAKALAQDFTERTFCTSGGQFVGTPEYVSPEQADLRDKDIDARSDVYSLGVILYVLLTGALPFDLASFREGGMEQIRRTIREEDPQSPSTRLSELGERATQIAKNRRTEVVALAKTLKTELEWVPLKAMQKEREHRYQSVGDLAQDVQRYLSGVPLDCGRLALAYRLRKFSRRHRMWITTIFVVVITLLVGLYLGRTMDLRNGTAPGIGHATGTPTSASGGSARLRVVIHVDARAQGECNGASWGNAFTDLQDALRTVRAGDEIRVARGTYKPDQSRTATSSGRDASFILGSGVALYGGFPADGGEWEQRDPTQYETILSGDIGVPSDSNDNSYHVVVASWTDAKTVLDGFTITCGNAGVQAEHSAGGGLYNISGHLTVRNCLFTGNAADCGAGVYNQLSEAKFLNCRFVANVSGTDGGGMFNRRGDTLLCHCVFAANRAGRSGGGLFLFEPSRPSIINCRFAGNLACVDGGGIFNHHSACLIVGCLFQGNEAVGYGGGLLNAECSELVRSVNCTFRGNKAGTRGGALVETNSPHEVVNCIFWGNQAAQGGPQIELSARSRVNIHHCCVQGGQAGVAADDSTLDWRSGNIATDPRFVDADGPDGTVGTDDGRLELSAGSPCIDAGDSRELPTDIADLDADGDLQEPIPLDLAGGPRLVDDHDTPDTGIADSSRNAAIVDIGAHEVAR